MVSGEKCDKCGWRWKWVDMEMGGGRIRNLMKKNMGGFSKNLGSTYLNN